MDKAVFVSLGAVLAFLVTSAIALGLVATFFTPLWNYGVAGTFGLPELTYLQAFALLAVVRILFPGKSTSSTQTPVQEKK